MCVCVEEGAKIALLRSYWTLKICSLGPFFFFFSWTFFYANISASGKIQLRSYVLILLA